LGAIDQNAEEIPIPDATAEPAAYVRALLAVLGRRDPLLVLSATPAEVDRIITSSAAALERSPADGGWSFRDVLGHLLDVDIVYGFRIRLVLTADLPTYPGYDEKGFSSLPKLNANGLAGAFRWLRAANIELLKTLTPVQMAREGVHSEQGRENVDLMVRKLAGHDLAHLQQMRRAVEAAVS
jgi:hypothetical protein